MTSTPAPASAAATRSALAATAASTGRSPGRAQKATRIPAAGAGSLGSGGTSGSEARSPGCGPTIAFAINTTSATERASAPACSQVSVFRGGSSGTRPCGGL